MNLSKCFRLKSPDILQNETTRERKENNLEDFFNTSDSVSKNSKGEKVSTEIRKKGGFHRNGSICTFDCYFWVYIFFYHSCYSIRFAFLQDEILKTCCYFRQLKK